MDSRDFCRGISTGLEVAEGQVLDCLDVACKHDETLYDVISEWDMKQYRVHDTLPLLTAKVGRAKRVFAEGLLVDVLAGGGSGGGHGDVPCAGEAQALEVLSNFWSGVHGAYSRPPAWRRKTPDSCGSCSARRELSWGTPDVLLFDGNEIEVLEVNTSSRAIPFAESLLQAFVYALQLSRCEETCPQSARVTFAHVYNPEMGLILSLDLRRCNLESWYGRFAKSWIYEPKASRVVKPWFRPLMSGGDAVTQRDGGCIVMAASSPDYGPIRLTRKSPGRLFRYRADESEAFAEALRRAGRHIEIPFGSTPPWRF